jgi:hypothetical protein
MSHVDFHDLKHSDQVLLNLMQRVVPVDDRADWLRTWHAELWHLRHNTRCAHVSLSLGLTRDALWLRTESWRRAYTGTVALCLVTLTTLCLVATLISLAITGSPRDTLLYYGVRFPHFLVGAPFVVLVSFAMSPRRHVEQGSSSKLLFWLKRQLFFAAKASLLLLLSFLISADLFEAVHGVYPLTCDLLEIVAFVIFSLLGLRWSFLDQQTRCRQCLRSLTTPARVGRPSHNLLEWNGTELLCRDGHGALSVPEIETSWCRSSHWIYQGPIAS